MFDVSFIMDAFGNDVTTGAKYPLSASVFTALPVGHRCGAASPYTVNGTATNYCGTTTLMQGRPATAQGTLASVTFTPSAPVALPQSAFSLVTAGSLPSYASYVYSGTYASFANEAGSFFVGGGPGHVVFTAAQPLKGGVVMSPGPKQFGGAMGLLGKLGARMIWAPNQGGSQIGTTSWAMIPVIGRTTSFMFTTTGTLMSYPRGATSLRTNVATGFPWTTGMVTVLTREGVFTTSFRRSGYDNRTSGGVGVIQLVTPQLTHWRGVGRDTVTGAVGILKIHVVPEPALILLIAAGAGVLALLHRAGRHS